MRTLLSDEFKQAVLSDPRSQAELATLAQINVVQFSLFMHDRVGIGATTAARLARLGVLLGLAEGDCFRAVQR